MDLLKLKLKRTDKIVGADWHEYKAKDMPEMEVVLVRISEAREYPEYMDIMLMENEKPTEPKICTAKFINMGANKINVIKAVREVTDWGLKESKDFTESFPKILTPQGGLSKKTLQTLVSGVTIAGGSAEMVIGSHCDTCEVRFRCFTER